MDESEDEFIDLSPMRHDRWSVLALALNWGMKVAASTAGTLEGYTIMAVRHGAQIEQDRKFRQIVGKM